MTKFFDILEQKIELTPSERGVAKRWFLDIERNMLFANSISSGGGGGGVSALSAGNVEIDWAEGVTLRNPDTGARTIFLDPDGDAWFGSDVDDPDSTTMFIISNDNLYNGESFGAGDLLLGSNSAGKANIWWDASAGELNFRSGTTISGTIGAGGLSFAWGSIGGWSIDATRIYKSGIQLNSTNDQIEVGAGITLDGAGETITVGASVPTLIIDGANKVIKSSNFDLGAAGFQLNAVNGDAEFNNIVARGTFRTSVFQFENLSAIGGHLVVSKSAAEVNTEVTTAATFTLVLKNDDVGAVLVAQNDILELKGWNGTELIDVYVTVGVVTDQGATASFTATLNSGGTGKVLQRGMGVVNLGASGGGIITLQAGDLGDAAIPTRIAIATHAGAPWTTRTNKVVLVDMYGTYGASTNHRYGLGIGDYATGNYLSYNAKVADQFILKAGNESITLDETGVSIIVGEGWESEKKYRFVDAGDNDLGGMQMYQYSGTTQMRVVTESDATFPISRIDVHAIRGHGGSARVQMKAGTGAVVSVNELDDGTRSVGLTSDYVFATGDYRTEEGASIGAGSPPYTEARGNLFLDYSGSGSYGFINSVSNLHLFQNMYYKDGAWKAIGTGKTGGFQTSMGSNYPLYVSSSQASYTIGQTPVTYVNFSVGNDSKLRLYISGTNTEAAQIYSDTSWFRINPSGGQNIYSPQGLRADGGLSATSTGGAPIAGVVHAQQLRIFEGTTLIGDLSAQDSIWFRINQNVAKNIYTPRSFAAAGALSVGTSNFGSAGDVMYTNNLRPIRSTGTLQSFTFVPLITPIRIHYAWLASTTGNIWLGTWFPQYTRAIAVRIYTRDTASADTGAQYYSVGPSAANPYAVIVRTHKANSHFENSGVVPASGTVNSYVYWKTQAGSGASLLVELWVYGYWT